MRLSFAPVVAEDFESMAELRIAALRESLERLGRFDPQRARARLQAAFVPQYMQHICLADERIGYVTLRPTDESSLHLEHLYIRPGQQGQGVGAWAMAWIKNHGQDVTLSALRLSDANRFYLRHGFEVVGESAFDIDYRWKAQIA
jgi:GNAT superfamily N-acetyltransferase